MKDAEMLFIELLNNQLKKIQGNQRLQYDDLKRITKCIDSSIFDRAIVVYGQVTLLMPIVTIKVPH